MYRAINLSALGVGWIMVCMAIIIFEPSHYVNILSFLVFVFLLFYLLFKHNDFFVVSALFIFGVSVSIVSSIIIEYGHFLYELQVQTYLNGSAAKNILLFCVLLVFSLLSFECLKAITPTTKTSTLLNGIIKNAVILFYIFAICLLLYVVFAYGTATSYGQDRFYYLNNVFPENLLWVRPLMEQLSPILGVLYMESNKKKRYLFLLFASCLSQMLIGEKFTGIFQSIMLFSIPVIILMNIKVSDLLKNWRFVFLFSLCFFLLFGLVLYSYYIIQGDVERAYESFVGRIVSQFQMLWALSEPNIPQLSWAIFLENYLGFKADPENTGMIYLMSVLMPEDLFRIYFENGISLTSASPANNVYFFGFGGAVFSCAILGGLAGVSFWFFYYSIRVRDLMLIFLATKLLFMALYICLMGRVYLLTTIKFLPLVFFAIFYALFLNCFSKRNLVLYDR